MRIFSLNLGVNLFSYFDLIIIECQSKLKLISLGRFILKLILYKEHQEINNALFPCFSAQSMPEVSVVIEAMLSKQILIFMWQQLPEKQTDCWGKIIHFLWLSRVSQILISDKMPQNIAFEVLHSKLLTLSVSLLFLSFLLFCQGSHHTNFQQGRC